MLRAIKVIHILPVLLALLGSSFAFAQEGIASRKNAKQDGCIKQPRHEDGTPRIINFCECLPSGRIYADPASWSGEVDVQFDVDVKGILIRSQILKSSGFKQVDHLVSKATSKCRFEPASKNGIAVKGPLVQRYIFEDSDSFGENGKGWRVENGGK